MSPAPVSLENSLDSRFGNSIILLTPLSSMFEEFHYSQRRITKIHLPSRSDEITPEINCTHVTIFVYSGFSKTSVYN